MKYPVPRKVQIGPHPYRVRVTADVDFTVNGTVKGSDEAEGLLGHANHRDAIIDIGSDMSLSQLQDTLLHEALHGVLLLAGQDDEKLVWALAPALLDLLQRNPKLVEFLMQRRVVSW